MNIGFYLTKADKIGYVFADFLIDSIHNVLPGVSIHQFTDMTSPSVWGVDVVHRLKPEPLCLARAAHYGSVDGDWLFLDTDCVVQSDMVKMVFDQEFDIAVTDRNWPHIDMESDPAMPYCSGVLFSRSPQFWAEMYETEALMPSKAQEWYAEQKALPLLLPKYKHVVLPGNLFQYPPDSHEYPMAVIAHYKGERKQHLLRRIQGVLSLVV